MSRAFAYFSGFVVLGLVAGAFGPALKHFARQTGVSLDDVGVLFWAMGAGHLIGNGSSGRLYDFFPGHRVIAAALAALAVVLLVAPWVTALWLLMIVVLVMGIAKGILNSGGNTLVLWSYKENSAPYLTVLHFCFGTGAFLSPIVLSQMIVHTGGIAPGYVVFACCAALVLVWFARLPGLVAPSRTIAPPRSGKDRKFVLLLGIFLFLYTGTELGFGGWIFVYASVHHASTLEAAGYLTSSFWGALTLTRLAATPLMKQNRTFVPLLVALSICLGNVVVLTIGETDASLWVGTIGLGAGMAIVYPMVMVLANQTVEVSGRTIGRLGVSASLGGMSIPWLVGRLSRSVGAEILLGFPLVTLPLALVALLVLRIGSGRRTLQGPRRGSPPVAEILVPSAKPCVE